MDSLLALFTELNQVTLILQRVESLAQHRGGKLRVLIISCQKFKRLNLSAKAYALFLILLLLCHLKLKLNAVSVLLLFALLPKLFIFERCAAI